MRTPRGHHTLGAILAAVAVVVAACAGDEARETAPPDDLDDAWRFSHGSGPDGEIPVADDDHRPTLTIDGSDWGGQVCNHYSTNADVDGTDVTLDGVVATEMACVNGGIMESEAAYLDAFARVEGVEVVAERLVLRGDEVELVYEREEPEPDTPLTGTTWQLESLVPGDGPDAAVSSAADPAELRFDGDGTMTASTGCRELAGPYHLDMEQLDLTEVGIDDAECDDDHLVDQDEHVEATLLSGTAIRFEIEGDRLELTAPTGRGLHYRAE
jgi:heat shock protein HslJ